VYDEVRWARGARPPPSDVSESFYESVGFGGSELDPNYELLPAVKAGSETDELYASIRERPALREGPYARIRHGSTSPPYESIARPPLLDSDSDSDTIGYESVRAASSITEREDTTLGSAAQEEASEKAGETPAAANAVVDLSQLYARVRKAPRREEPPPTAETPPLPAPFTDVTPPIPMPLTDVASSIPDADDSGAVVRMDSSSASTSQYTSASESGTPLLPKRLDELDSPQRRRSVTSVDSGSVTQSDRDDLASLLP